MKEMKMSKLTITEAVKILPVSESTLRRDLKSGKVSYEKDQKGRKQIDVSELQRVYEQLRTQNGSQPPTDESAEHSEPVNDTHQNPSMNGNDSPKIIGLLEEQVQDLKERLAKADTEKAQLLDLADRLQKQKRAPHAPKSKEKKRLLGIPPPKKIIPVMKKRGE